MKTENTDSTDAKMFTVGTLKLLTCDTFIFYFSFGYVEGKLLSYNEQDN